MSRHYAMIRELIEEGAYDPTTPAGNEIINRELRTLPQDAAELLATWALNKRHEADIRNRKRQGGRWGIPTLEIGDYVVTSGGDTGRIEAIIGDPRGDRFEIACSPMNCDEPFSLYLRSFDLVELVALEG